MGAAARRKREFLALHPHCCYCGGSAATSTLDHNPARAFFPVGGVPKGFAFPACSSCNSARSSIESKAALILNSFNLSEPVGVEHKRKTAARLRSFLLRDQELRELIQAQFPGRLAPYSEQPFQVTMALKLAVLYVGKCLLQALYYRKTGNCLSADKHLLVRFATNYVDRDEAAALATFFSSFTIDTPATADPKIPARFRWGYLEMRDDVLLVGAEIIGSTTWFGAIQSEKPTSEEAEKFDWFGGDGRLIRLSDSEEVIS